MSLYYCSLSSPLGVGSPIEDRESVQLSLSHAEIIAHLSIIITLKAIALFSRQKARDLFDMTIILERELMSIKELERIYSFVQKDNKTLLQYIQQFGNDDDGDASLDFLPHHEHYKEFFRLSQNERFEKCKLMFLQQYDIKEREDV